MATDFELLRRRLEYERERLIERLEADCQAVGQRQDNLAGHQSLGGTAG